MSDIVYLEYYVRYLISLAVLHFELAVQKYLFLLLTVELPKTSVISQQSAGTMLKGH